MQKKKDEFSDFSIQQARKLAQSGAGQELLALLQNTQGEQFRQAMEQAAAGDYAKVKESLEAMMSSPEARELLEKLRG